MRALLPRSRLPPAAQVPVLATALALALAGVVGTAWGSAGRPAGDAAAPHEFGCPIFPASNPINRDISRAPVDPRSAEYIASDRRRPAPARGLRHQPGLRHPVHGRRRASAAKVPIHFTEYGEESNPGPYPIPPDAPVEGAGEEGDRHVLVLQRGSCKLYELYAARRARAAAGKRARARSSTCAATRCARKAGPPPTRRGCRSSRCSCATPRSTRDGSTTRCA